MLPQFGFAELLLLAVLALVVVGPRELPLMLRRVGDVVRQARQMGREFQRSFDEIGRETELSELRREIQSLKRLEPLDDVRKPLDDLRDEARGLENDWRHGGDAPASATSASASASATPAPALQSAPAQTAAAGQADAPAQHTAPSALAAASPDAPSPATPSVAEPANKAAEPSPLDDASDGSIPRERA